MHTFSGTDSSPCRAAALALCCAVLVLAALAGCSPLENELPLAQKGVLDLTGWDPAAHGPVELDGEWECYWGRLLEPSDFTSSPPTPEGYLSLPAPWNGMVVDGRPLDGQGAATFRLLVRAGSDMQGLSLRLFNVKAASALWVNGRLILENGHVSVSTGSEMPHVSNRLAGLTLREGMNECILQVSNHVYREGGVASSICLGTTAAMQGANLKQNGLAWLFAGIFLAVGINHIVFFLLRRNDPSHLYYGLYCLFWFGFYICADASQWAIRLFLPEAGSVMLGRAGLSCLFLSIAFAYTFFRALFPREFSSRLSFLVWGISLVSMLLLASDYTLMRREILIWFYLWAALLILYCVAMLGRAFARGRKGASYLFAGFCALGVVGMNDMLLDTGLVRTVSIIPFGMCGFILLQSFHLAHRSADAYGVAERLSSELSVKNRDLEEEMARRIELTNEVVAVSEQERRRLSHDLHDGLCQQLTGARLRCSALERRPDRLGEAREELADLSALLKDMTSHAYDLSRGLWPVEVNPEHGLSLEELARYMSDSSGVHITFSQDLECETCSSENIVQLYRITQEAVTNALKHARPSRIAIRLQCDARRRLTLTVRDDGTGMPGSNEPPSGRGGLGLRMMAHRATMIGATLDVTPGQDGGTVITCSLGCPEEDVD